MSVLIRGQLRRANIAGLILGTAAAVAIYFIGQAHAATVTCNKQGCTDRAAVHIARHTARTIHDANGNRVLIGARPHNCPHAWCGCGLMHYLGLTDKRLWKAWNWARLFPHTHAHPGAAAVKAHHVMLLVRHVSGSHWLVRSYNDYRHEAWLIVRSVRGYVFVEPQPRFASNTGRN